MPSPRPLPRVRTSSSTASRWKSPAPISRTTTTRSSQSFYPARHLPRGSFLSIHFTPIAAAASQKLDDRTATTVQRWKEAPMASASFVEIISHFAGYLQIFQDIARDRIEYDETLAPHRSDDYTTPRPDHDQPFTPDDPEPQAGPAPNPIPDDPVQLAHLHPIKALSHPQDPDLDFFPPSHFPNIRLPMPGGGGGGGGSHGDHHIKVAYQPGGEQTEVEVHQHNIMYDNDTMLPAGAVFPADGLTARLDADAMTTLQHMADDANTHIPTDWWIPQNGTAAVEFLTAFDMAWADGGPDANSVQPGYYLNGVLQDPAPPAP